MDQKGLMSRENVTSEQAESTVCCQFFSFLEYISDMILIIVTQIFLNAPQDLDQRSTINISRVGNAQGKDLMVIFWQEVCATYLHKCEGTNKTYWCACAHVHNLVFNVCSSNRNYIAVLQIND